MLERHGPRCTSCHMDPTPTPNAAQAMPQASEGWLRAGLRALGGLLSLTFGFVPELIAAFVGVVVGGILGFVSGAGLTASLLDGGGSWGHAGPVALLLPVFAFLGPLVLGVVIGAMVLPTLTLGIHALVILVRRSDKMVARRLVVLTTAAGVFVPAMLLGLDAGLAGESYLGGAFSASSLPP